MFTEMLSRKFPCAPPVTHTPTPGLHISREYTLGTDLCPPRHSHAEALALGGVVFGNGVFGR